MVIGACDICGAQNVELVRSELAGLETWSCWEECPKTPQRPGSSAIGPARPHPANIRTVNARMLCAPNLRHPSPYPLKYLNPEAISPVTTMSGAKPKKGISFRHDEVPYYHATPKPDACDHDFQGWMALKDEAGRECGGTTVCTKCGMDAMTYSLRCGA